MLTVKQ